MAVSAAPLPFALIRSKPASPDRLVSRRFRRRSGPGRHSVHARGHAARVHRIVAVSAVTIMPSPCSLRARSLTCGAVGAVAEVDPHQVEVAGVHVPGQPVTADRVRAQTAHANCRKGSTHDRGSVSRSRRTAHRACRFAPQRDVDLVQLAGFPFKNTFWKSRVAGLATQADRTSPGCVHVDRRTERAPGQRHRDCEYTDQQQQTLAQPRAWPTHVLSSGSPSPVLTHCSPLRVVF